MNEKGDSGLWVIINDLVVRVRDLESQVIEVAKEKEKWREKDERIEEMKKEMARLKMENDELKMASYKNEIEMKTRMISKLHNEIESLKMKTKEIESNRAKAIDGHDRSYDRSFTHPSGPPTHPLTLLSPSQMGGCLPKSISEENHRENGDDEENDKGECRNMAYQTFADLISESDLIIKDQNDTIKYLEDKLDTLKIEIKDERWQNGKWPKNMDEICFENKSKTNMMENERKKENNDLKQSLKKMESSLNDMTNLATGSMEDTWINEESVSYGDILFIDESDQTERQRHGTLSESYQWEFASNIQWPEPQSPYFQFMVEQQIKSGRKYGCQDELITNSLHNFLLSQKEISESYGLLCSQIEITNLNDLVSNLDSLDPSAKFMFPEERFKEIKPMENDHAITYMNRLEMLQSRYFGHRDTNLIKQKRIQNQFLNNFSLKGLHLSDLEKLILRQNSSLISMASNAQEILESKIESNILKYGLRQ